MIFTKLSHMINTQACVTIYCTGTQTLLSRIVLGMLCGRGFEEISFMIPLGLLLAPLEIERVAYMSLVVFNISCVCSLSSGH